MTAPRARCVWTDRSRTEDYQRCKRLRFWQYHEGPEGRGIVPARKPLPLAVGGSLHVGLSELLLGFVHQSDSSWYATYEQDLASKPIMAELEERAVAAALADFATHANALELDAGEVRAQTTRDGEVMDFGAPAVADGASPETQLIVEQIARSKSDFDRYLYAEQSALVEALVRAYARRRLGPLLERYEVLEVEHEGEWKLSEWDDQEHRRAHLDVAELWFASRPDALLLERDSGGLYILSYKSAASWDWRKEADAQHDAQGLSEGVEIEKRLGGWWEMLQRAKASGNIVREVRDAKTHEPVIPERMLRYLRDECRAAPRILGIRYEYVFKGERREDRELSARLGLTFRSQRSPLVRAYRSAGMTDADAQWCWSYEYLKPTGEESKLYWKAWPSTSVWEHMPIKTWIDWLDDAAQVVSGDTGAELGFGCQAQACGTTRQHPLDTVFHPPFVVYRSDDQLRDWMEQTEAQERGVAEDVARVQAATDEGERRSLLNQLFPQSRKSCCYPTLCVYEKLCFGGEDIRRDPVGSGLYKIRVPNHPQELTP